MAIIAQGNINLNKIDQSKLVQGKNGAEYLNVTIFINDDKNQYGYDVDLVQTQSKQERMAGETKIYLGNGIITMKK